MFRQYSISMSREEKTCGVVRPANLWSLTRLCSRPLTNATLCTVKRFLQLCERSLNTEESERGMARNVYWSEASEFFCQTTRRWKVDLEQIAALLFPHHYLYLFILHRCVPSQHVISFQASL